MKRKALLATVIFVFVIIAGGVALSASGNWENPFAAFSTLSGEAAPPDRSTSDTLSMAERPEGRGGESEGVNWSQFGQVLYNVWFLFAAAVVVMVIGFPVRFIRNLLRQRSTVLQV